MFLSMLHNPEHYKLVCWCKFFYTTYLRRKSIARVTFWKVWGHHSRKKHRSETKMYAGILKWYLHFAGDWCQLHLQRKKNTKSFQKVYEKQEWLLIIRCCMQKAGKLKEHHVTNLMVITNNSCIKKCYFTTPLATAHHQVTTKPESWKLSIPFL